MQANGSSDNLGCEAARKPSSMRRLDIAVLAIFLRQNEHAPEETARTMRAKITKRIELPLPEEQMPSLRRANAVGSDTDLFSGGALRIRLVGSWLSPV